MLKRSRVEPHPGGRREAGRSCGTDVSQSAQAGLERWLVASRCSPWSCPRDLFQQKETVQAAEQESGDRLPHTVGADGTQLGDTT